MKHVLIINLRLYLSHKKQLTVYCSLFAHEKYDTVQNVRFQALFFV